MNNIKINCGFCGAKNCTIKKDFRILADKYDLHPFELKCGHETPKHENGTKISFTIAHGFEKFEKQWECTNAHRSEYYNCRGCRFGERDMCDGGLVTYINRRHTKTETITGTIYGYIGSGKYIVITEASEYWRIKKTVNPKEMKVIENIHNKMSESNSGTYITNYNTDTFDSDFYFVTKSKYIKII